MKTAGCSCLLAMVVFVGCAQPATNPVPATATARPIASAEGTILSMRPIAVRSDRAPWRIALIADASAATAITADGNIELTEFIVRTGDGATISIVQPDAPGFRPGDRIVILRNGPARIARPG
jgi:outer membrane lipoprotein SlyB